MLIFSIFIFLTTGCQILECALDIFENDNEKETIEFSNGFKIYYVRDTSSTISSVDFKINLLDTPSNTALYHLLEHIIIHGENIIKESIIGKGGSMLCSTSVNKMCFSIEIHEEHLKETIQKFYDSFYHTKISKKAIKTEIQNIEEEFMANEKLHDSIMFYYTQVFYNIDKYKMFQIGNRRYYELYFHNYASKGKLFDETETGFTVFSKKQYIDLFEGYKDLLEYLNENRLRKYPISVFIKTGLSKNKIIQIFSKFELMKHNFIKKRTVDFENKEVYNNLTFVESKQSAVCTMISVPPQKSLYLSSIILNEFSKRMNKIFDGGFIYSYYILNGKMRLFCIFNMFEKIDYDLLSSLIFDNGNLVSYSDYENFLNNDEIFLNDPEKNKTYKKIAILINIAIINTVSKIEFNLDQYNETLQKRKLFILNEPFKRLDNLPFIHLLAESMPSLFKKKNVTSLSKNFEKIKYGLLDIRNYSTLFTYKTPDTVDRIDIDKFEYSSLPFKLSEIINQDLYVLDLTYQDDLYVSDCVEFVKIEQDLSSFSLIFKVDLTPEGKLVLQFLKMMLEGYRDLFNKHNYYNQSAKITIGISFKNVLSLTIYSCPETFQCVIESLLTTFKLFLRSKSVFLSTKKELLEHDNMLSKEKFRHILIDFESLKSYFCVKALYIGENNNQILKMINNEMNLMEAKWRKETPLSCNRTFPQCFYRKKDFNSQYIVLHNKDVESFEGLMINKIASIIFSIKSQAYFTGVNSIGYNSELQTTYHPDFHYFKFDVVSVKENSEIKLNILEFVVKLNKWIQNITVKDFNSLKKTILSLLLQKDTNKWSLIFLQLSRWGFNEDYTTLNMKIKDFINTFTMKQFKQAMTTHFSENLKCSF
ncbi:hypothetical protein NGRA_1168 [Nosema granulosis]|uniref:Peptidase M16 N-terminal domain-containing protein n=1 Tax=Nosema granulosis TaxID=83296 RepID=A0A9P6GZ18_9MICR|nr:hypothetical protein NGRA_1168 [Nosema granulosis]